VRFEVIHSYRAIFSVERMCQVFDVSPSGYYAWRGWPASQRTQENESLVKEIKDIYEKSRKTYGSPRVHAELLARGFQVGKNRVAQLMRAAKIRARRKKKGTRTTDSNHHHPVAPNLLNRDFEAQQPNEKWLGDITYIWTQEGWLYLATIMDLFSRKIVGWAMENTLASCLVEKAFRMAVRSRNPQAGLLHHSDRGSQYAGQDYQFQLANYRMQVSMSRTGNCYDNAPMESFFSTLKVEWVHFQEYKNRKEARTDIFDYIEGFYNRTRRHSALGYLSPLEFERQYFASLS
jgi:putative transposase